MGAHPQARAWPPDSRSRVSEGDPDQTPKGGRKGSDQGWRRCCRCCGAGHGAGPRPRRPRSALPQLTTSDTTQEAVAILCQENDGRIGIWSDEGETVRNIAGRYSKDQSPSVELYLKGYSGGYYSSSRVGREGISLQDPAISMVLAIQPEVIRGISNQRALHGQGFFARYQYAVPPSALGSRISRPEPADDRAREAYDNLIKALLNMSLPKDEYEEISPHVLEFSEA